MGIFGPLPPSERSERQVYDDIDETTCRLRHRRSTEPDHFDGGPEIDRLAMLIEELRVVIEGAEWAESDGAPLVLWRREAEQRALRQDIARSRVEHLFGERHLAGTGVKPWAS